MGQFSEAGSWLLEGWGQWTWGWRSSANRVCCGGFKGRRPIWSSSRACGLTQATVSVGWPLPKRKWVATATVASPTAQESEAIAPKPEVVCLCWMPSSVYSSTHRGNNTSWDEALENQCGWHQASLWLLCQGMCRVTIHLLSNHMLSCESGPFGHGIVLSHLSPHFFNTNAIQHHGKLLHPSGSSDLI